jgi:hypothetical protein
MSTPVPVSQFVHTLLFACPDCKLPVAVSHLSNARTLEPVDAQTITIACAYCKSSHDVLAATARKHFVDTW